jgi:hypothetical protein
MMSWRLLRGQMAFDKLSNSQRKVADMRLQTGEFLRGLDARAQELIRWCNPARVNNSSCARASAPSSCAERDRRALGAIIEDDFNMVAFLALTPWSADWRASPLSLFGFVLCAENGALLINYGSLNMTQSQCSRLATRPWRSPASSDIIDSSQQRAQSGIRAESEMQAATNARCFRSTPNPSLRAKRSNQEKGRAVAL